MGVGWASLDVDSGVPQMAKEFNPASVQAGEDTPGELVQPTPGRGRAPQGLLSS